MIRLLSLILLSGYALAHGQVDFKGNIMDLAGQPIPGAHVSLRTSTTISDLEGHFEFTSLQEGESVMEIQALGFLTWRDTLFLASDTELEIKLEEQSYDIEVVKLSASWIKPGQPFSYSSMDKEDIRTQNFGKDMPYLLQNLPSTVVTSDAGTGIGYTGIRIRGSDPTRINVTLDGVPVNDAESQGVFWVDLPDLASYAGAIQVQRGVGTSTNGAGAFGATVNIKTSGLEDQMYGILDFTGGSFNTLRANVKFGTGLIDKKLSFQGSLSHIQSDGYIDRASSDLNSVYLSGTLLGNNNSLKINFLRG
ncbi:MAG: TonB-dependent receptor, partial [Saprospiraceae bacterium]|nr:TonB-dependent receptor [Saprospiraceae bacterium]